MTHENLWFTRATLRSRAPDVAPIIRSLFDPTQEGRQANSAHRLLWTLMPEEMQHQGKPASETGEKAAFLWRAGKPERDQRYYLLGPQPRRDSAFFEVDSTPWTPALSIGDRLRFDLLVNATVNRMMDPSKGRDGRKRIDVVADALLRRRGAAEDPADVAGQTMRTALEQWWRGQGAANGFLLLTTAVDQHRTLSLDDRRRGQTHSHLGIARLTGSVEVRDPAAFVARVAAGFGRGKAFGCGLMLLKREGAIDD